MNWAHVHIAINHAPVVGIIFGFLLLTYGMVRKSEELKKASLGIFVIIALIAIPVYFTGGGAEEVVEHLPGVSESIIEKHEDSAFSTFVMVEILGLLTLGGLFLYRSPQNPSTWFVILSLILSILVCGLMARTANLGGQIRHTEIRSKSI
jgi:uncharacterized membrane protein